MEEGGENNQEDCEKASGEWGKKEEGRSRDVGIKDGEKDGYFGKDRKTRDQRRIEISKALFFSPFPPPSSFICGGRSRSLMHTAACRALYIIIIYFGCTAAKGGSEEQ